MTTLLAGTAGLVAWQALRSAPAAAQVGLAFGIFVLLIRGGVERPLWAIYAAGSTAVLMPLTVTPELPASAVTSQWLAVAGVASVVTYAAARLTDGGRRLLQLEDRKQRFIALTNHELRTPVAVVHSVLENLTDDLQGQLSPEQEQFLQMAVRCSSDLVRRLEMLSQLQALAEDPARPDSVRTRCEDILKVAAAAVEPQAAARDVVVHSELTAAAAKVKLPEMDARCLAEQLLDNAVKFSPPGGIVSAVGYVDGSALVLEICDRGPGIPLRLRRAVFESFYQPGDLLHRQSGGMGVGLAVARLAALRMGATLHVRSRPRGGTRIRVDVPAIEAAPATTAADPRGRWPSRAGWAVRGSTSGH